VFRATGMASRSEVAQTGSFDLRRLESPAPPRCSVGENRLTRSGCAAALCGKPAFAEGYAAGRPTAFHSQASKRLILIVPPSGKAEPFRIPQSGTAEPQGCERFPHTLQPDIVAGRFSWNPTSIRLTNTASRQIFWQSTHGPCTPCVWAPCSLRRVGTGGLW
jgi:hypothetical protein